MPKSVTESLGLYRERVHPTGTPAQVDGWWEVGDRSDAVRVVADIVRRMDGGIWELLDSMVTRVGILEMVRAGDLGHMKCEHHDVFFARAEALLLMDAGESAALESCLERALDGAVPRQREAAEAFDVWVRDQAKQIVTGGSH